MQIFAFTVTASFSHHHFIKKGKMKSHAKQLSHSEPACTFLSEELLEAQFRGGDLLLAAVEVESIWCLSALTL